MTIPHPVWRMLATTFAAVGIALALSANAATFTERSNDRIDADRDREASVPAQGRNDADSDRQNRSSTEAGVNQDRQIAERVQAALDDDPELKETFLRVEANNAHIRVQGMVATTSQRDRAIETASAVQGVAGVDDGITLRQSPGQPPASR